MKKILLIASLIFIGLLLFGYFVYPTRYRYDHIKIGQNDLPMRTDRVTGKTEVFMMTGWIDQSPKPGKPEIQLAPWDIAKITGTAAFSTQYFDFQAYNGTPFVLSEVTIAITVFDEDHKAIISGRQFRLHSTVSLDPKSSGTFIADLRFSIDPRYQTWEYSIAGAKGHQE